MGAAHDMSRAPPACCLLPVPACSRQMRQNTVVTTGVRGHPTPPVVLGLQVDGHRLLHLVVLLACKGWALQVMACFNASKRTAAAL